MAAAHTAAEDAVADANVWCEKHLHLMQQKFDALQLQRPRGVATVRQSERTASPAPPSPPARTNEKGVSKCDSPLTAALQGLASDMAVTEPPARWRVGGGCAQSGWGVEHAVRVQHRTRHQNAAALRMIERRAIADFDHETLVEEEQDDVPSPQQRSTRAVLRLLRETRADSGTLASPSSSSRPSSTVVAQDSTSPAAHLACSAQVKHPTGDSASIPWTKPARDRAEALKKSAAEPTGNEGGLCPNRGPAVCNAMLPTRPSSAVACARPRAPLFPAASAVTSAVSSSSMPFATPLPQALDQLDRAVRCEEPMLVAEFDPQRPKNVTVWCASAQSTERRSKSDHKQKGTGAVPTAAARRGAHTPRPIVARRAVSGRMVAGSRMSAG